MLHIIFIIFLLVPLVEIGIFILFGQTFGLWPTLLGVVLTALIGSFIIKKQGISLFSEIKEITAKGALPAKQLTEAMMIAIAGAFLLTPGYFTDSLGFLLLIPMIRALIYEKLKSRFFVESEIKIYDSYYQETEFTKKNDREYEKTIDLDEKNWRD